MTQPTTCLRNETIYDGAQQPADIFRVSKLTDAPISPQKLGRRACAPSVI